MKQAKKVANAHDVAAYILERQGEMAPTQLQKLLYYCQAWNLVWAEEPLFPEQIEAWIGGPAVKELYDIYRGQYTLSVWPEGDSSRLSSTQREAIEAVVDSYSRLSTSQIDLLVHRESPWLKARGSLPAFERGANIIALSEMREYYSGLDNNNQATPIEDLSSIIEAREQLERQASQLLLN
jgi:uncharacterized phage-associated protein